jgi:hypothetical protein
VRRLMRFSSILLTGLILFCAASAFADSFQDPKIIIGDPPCTGPDCIHVTSDTFAFSLPTTQGSFFTGVLTFENDSPDTWYSLYLTESGVSWNNVQCGITAFFNFCQAVPSSSDPSQTIIEFLNILPNPGTGIASDNGFTLDFEPVNTVAWPSGTNFGGSANGLPVPEPGSTTLLLAEVLLFLGICAFGGRKPLRSLAANFSSNTR